MFDSNLFDGISFVSSSSSSLMFNSSFKFSCHLSRILFGSLICFPFSSFIISVESYYLCVFLLFLIFLQHFLDALQSEFNESSYSCQDLILASLIIFFISFLANLYLGLSSCYLLEVHLYVSLFLLLVGSLNFLFHHAVILGFQPLGFMLPHISVAACVIVTFVTHPSSTDLVSFGNFAKASDILWVYCSCMLGSESILELISILAFTLFLRQCTFFFLPF